jgi:hypothetical protein
MDINLPGTTRAQSGQLADSTIASLAAPDIPMAGATPSLCDAAFCVPELLAPADRREARHRPTLA